jgi:hypothetical protein
MTLYNVTLSTDMSIDKIEVIIPITEDDINNFNYFDKDGLEYLKERGMFYYKSPDDSFCSKFVIDMDFDFSNTDTKTYKRVKVAIRNWKLETLDV